MMTKKLLPIGFISLADIRNSGCYYVDKTPLIIELLKTSRYVFLSRPRRFGKSLTIDTIAELFSGNKELFKGLYAEHHWDWEQTYPVIKLSFAGLDMQGQLANLKQYIRFQLEENANRLGLSMREDLQNQAGLVLADLMLQTQQKYGKKVVVLIDEYDKPIIDNLNNAEIALEIRGILRSLYAQLKEFASNIRFAMLTGVSKFGQMSLFSGLNHIEDITLQHKYSALCGYTQAELEEVFAPELVGVDLDELKTWYNGYNWTGESVYNPFDILLFLKNDKLYQSYWIGTGGNSSFLMHLLQEHSFDFTQLDEMTDEDDILSSTDIGSLLPLPIMFQTGYLTIDKVIPDPTLGAQYTFKFPNREVRQALGSDMLRQLAPQVVPRGRKQLLLALRQGDLEAMQRIIKSIFAAIPSDWHRKNTIAYYEGYWASNFYMLFASICAELRLEESSYQGRADMVAIEQGQVYVFEFKMKQSGDAASALAQIKAKNYAEKYRATAKQIYEIGVSFDAQTRELEFAW